jgi:hypothetical protein
VELIPLCSHYIERAPEPPANFPICRRAQQSQFRTGPGATRRAAFENGNFKCQPFGSDGTDRTAQSAGNFLIRHRSKQPVFPRRPATGRRDECHATGFAHGDYFSDRALMAASQHGIRRIAELF